MSDADVGMEPIEDPEADEPAEPVFDDYDDTFPEEDE